ncbi:MAG: hypothetical protein BMS9Abin04_082 [Planctomycetia bacterium]|nr:MAG: hypothetical protein BMS9Abin04_082 [Planctomycetia bacterium]
MYHFFNGSEVGLLEKKCALRLHIAPGGVELSGSHGSHTPGETTSLQNVSPARPVPFPCLLSPNPHFRMEVPP